MNADAFRRAYVAARDAGYSGTRRAFADLVLATDLFRREVRTAAVAWVCENPEPEGTTQRRIAGGRATWAGWLRAQDEPYLRVVKSKDIRPAVPPESD